MQLKYYLLRKKSMCYDTDMVMEKQINGIEQEAKKNIQTCKKA